MTSLEVYRYYLDLVNKNSTHADIKIPEGKFVSLYNRESKKWLGEKLKDLLSTDDKNYLQNLLVVDEEAIKIKDNIRFSEFALPDDLFKYESSYSIASREGSAERILHNWDFKSKNIEVLLSDENYNPSFDYEETLIQLSGKKLLIYKSDFDLNKAFLTYYKAPIEIDIQGYIKIDGTTSKNVDPDLDDYLVDQILSRCALETIRRYENPDGAQLAVDRINREK
jgi:hypothetical protein